jgi:alpha-glucosidase (family GH31 glycosyl hydrolase)
MFGPSFLVAPVIRSLDELGSRRPRFPVYLPPGEWFDYWTGRRFRGPAVVDAAAPLDILPLFVLAGAIVPMMKAAERIPEGVVDPIELALYPCGSSSYTLIEEEGRTEFRLQPEKRGYSFGWSGPIARKFAVRVGRGKTSAASPSAKSGKIRLPASPT